MNKYKKVPYLITNTIGGCHTELKEGYLIQTPGKRFYGVSGQYGAWVITDIITGCIVGRCEKLDQVVETVTPKEKEIERVIKETDQLTEVIAGIFTSYRFLKIKWFNELFIRA